DGSVGVGPADLAALQDALVVQPGQDRHDGGVREVGVQPVPDLPGRQRHPGCLQRGQHGRLKLSRAAAGTMLSSGPVLSRTTVLSRSTVSSRSTVLSGAVLAETGLSRTVHVGASAPRVG